MACATCSGSSGSAFIVVVGGVVREEMGLEKNRYRMPINQSITQSIDHAINNPASASSSQCGAVNRLSCLSHRLDAPRGGGVRLVLTAQKEQPLVHVSPMIMIVAVAVPSFPPPLGSSYECMNE
jgi:hypothetical protein